MDIDFYAKKYVYFYLMNNVIYIGIENKVGEIEEYIFQFQSEDFELYHSKKSDYFYKSVFNDFVLSCFVLKVKIYENKKNLFRKI